MCSSLSNARLEEIKNAVVDMLEECEVNSFPIYCEYLVQKLNYVLIPYSMLDDAEKAAAISISPDAYSQIEINPVTGMFQYVIYYNDAISNKGRLRWSILHEIGHCYLGHHDLKKDDPKRTVIEQEANFFAKYTIAPPPIIAQANCNSPEEIARFFIESISAAYYSFDYYYKRVIYGPPSLLPYERRLLTMCNYIA